MSEICNCQKIIRQSMITGIFYFTSRKQLHEFKAVKVKVPKGIAENINVQRNKTAQKIYNPCNFCLVKSYDPFLLKILCWPYRECKSTILDPIVFFIDKTGGNVVNVKMSPLASFHFWLKHFCHYECIVHLAFEYTSCTLKLSTLSFKMIIYFSLILICGIH